MESWKRYSTKISFTLTRIDDSDYESLISALLELPAFDSRQILHSDKVNYTDASIYPRIPGTPWNNDKYNTDASSSVSFCRITGRSRWFSKQKFALTVLELRSYLPFIFMDFIRCRSLSRVAKLRWIIRWFQAILLENWQRKDKKTHFIVSSNLSWMTWPFLCFRDRALLRSESNGPGSLNLDRLTFLNCSSLRRTLITCKTKLIEEITFQTRLSLLNQCPSRILTEYRASRPRGRSDSQINWLSS